MRRISKRPVESNEPARPARHRQGGFRESHALAAPLRLPNHARNRSRSRLRGSGGGGGGNGAIWPVDVFQVILVILGIIMTRYFLCPEPKKERKDHL